MQVAFVGGAFHTLKHLTNHSTIEFDSNEFFRLLQQTNCQVTSARTNLKDSIGRADARFGNNCIYNSGILQEMLTNTGIWGKQGTHSVSSAFASLLATITTSASTTTPTTTSPC
eukprot:Colp12_sorted_trinity150504_noHs@14497